MIETSRFSPSGRDRCKRRRVRVAWSNTVARRSAPWLLILVLASRAAAQNGTYDWSAARSLGPGIQFARVETTSPRNLVVHGIRFDTTTPGLAFHTTGRRAEWVEGKAETDRRTTRDFLRQARAKGIPMVVAINADAFSPWPVPYNQTTPTNLLGLAVSRGELVSKPSGSPSFIRGKSGECRIRVMNAGADTSDIDLAVSGFAICLEDGKPLDGPDALHPRTGLGLDATNRYTIAVVIDGRQPASAGATTEELGDWMRYFGADDGINMDGGGSTTIAWWDPDAPEPDKCRLLNQPVGNGAKAESLPREQFRPTERANGNNLGVSVDGS